MKLIKQLLCKILAGIAIGFSGGAVICVFRLLTAKCDNLLSQFIFPLLHSDSIVYPILWGAGLVVLAIIVSLIIHAEPAARGGGIGHTVQETNGGSDSRWWSVILAKITSAPICLLAGLSFGRTGPAIELGSMAGKGIGSKLPFPAEQITPSEMVYSGAAAGLAALFNAPFAGTLFALEKLHRSFDLSLITILVSSLSAATVSIFAFGYNPIVSSSLPLTDPAIYVCLAVLGSILGILGHFYAFSLSFFREKMEENDRLPELLLWIIVFLTAGITGYFFPELTGSGSGIIAVLSGPAPAFRTLLFLLVGKYLFSMISTGSGLPGGTVFPLLAVGACLGQLFGTILSFAGTTFLLPGMAGFFTSVMGLPCTGILLLCEFSCRYENFFPLFLTCLFSYLTKRIICLTTHKMK